MLFLIYQETQNNIYGVTASSSDYEVLLSCTMSYVLFVAGNNQTINFKYTSLVP